MLTIQRAWPHLVFKPRQPGPTLVDAWVVLDRANQINDDTLKLLRRLNDMPQVINDAVGRAVAAMADATPVIAQLVTDKNAAVASLTTEQAKSADLQTQLTAALANAVDPVDEQAQATALDNAVAALDTAVEAAAPPPPAPEPAPEPQPDAPLDPNAPAA